MYGDDGDHVLVYRSRNVNYSRPAVRGVEIATGRATDVRGAPTSRLEKGLRPAGVHRYTPNDNEDNDDDDTSDNDENDDDDNDDNVSDSDEDADDSSTHPYVRSSFDSAYATFDSAHATSETSARSNTSSSHPRAEKHIVYLHRRPATTGTILKAPEQRYDPTKARDRPALPDPASRAPLPLPRAAPASQSPRPISLASTYRPVSRLSTTSTASSDTITPASYRRNTRLSAADLKPIDLTRSISSNISSASAPAASPSSPAPSQIPSTSYSARTSLHPMTSPLPPAMRPSPRTPAVIMFDTAFMDQEQGENDRRNESASGRVSGVGGTAPDDGGRSWQISDCDYSGLSEKQVQKLRKKGINPALYVEMRAARKKAGKIGILSGNTYLS